MSETATRRGGGRIWPWLIAGLFTFNVATGAAVIYFSRSDPSFAVEPDYYERALAWDQEAAALQRGRTIERAIEADARSGEVRVRLTEPDGSPFTEARVVATVFHHARMVEAQTVELDEPATGTFAGAARLDRPGRWEVRLSMERDGRTYLTSDTIVVAAAGE
jgi:nitrogen fixation protein FixH